MKMMPLAPRVLLAPQGGSKLKHKYFWNSIIHGMSKKIFKNLLWMPPNPKPLALLTGTQLPSFHSHKLVPTSDKSPESPTTSDRAVGTEEAGGPIVPPYFDGSVNPISNKGADYALRINTRPPGFSDLPESPTTSDELKSAALSNEVSNTNSSLPSYTTAVLN